MERKRGIPDWASHIQSALTEMEKEEKDCDAIAVETYRDYARGSFDVARKKYQGELDAYRTALDQGSVVIDTVIDLPFNESCGMRLSRFFRTLRDEARILALRCPQCQRVVFPPRPVCGFCRIGIGEREDDWLSLGDTGTVISIILATEREVDRRTGKLVGRPHPCGFIRLDGGDHWTVLVHYLEMIDPVDLKTGRRVKAVWKPRQERKGRMSDIDYFQFVEGRG